MSQASPQINASGSSTGGTAVERDARRAAERAGQPHLIFRDGAGHQVIHQLACGPDIALGRRRACEICLEWDPEVSRTHARIKCADGGWTIADEDSRNGTFVNRERLRAARRLSDGDIVVLGRTSILFRRPTSPDRGSQELSDLDRRILIELCRPLIDPAQEAPADDRAIADRLGLDRGELDGRMRALSERFAATDDEPAVCRERLVAAALQSGIVTPSDLG